MSKNSKEKFDVYISTSYVFRKSFHGKPTFYVSSAKRPNFVPIKNFSRDMFCPHNTKIYQFFAKLGVHTYSVDIEAPKFCLDYFDIKNVFAV
jgi:hypothetical protein